MEKAFTQNFYTNKIKNFKTTEPFTYDSMQNLFTLPKKQRNELSLISTIVIQMIANSR